MEESSGIAFRTFQLLGNEDGLFGKIRINCHRLSADGCSTYERAEKGFRSGSGLKTNQTRVPVVPEDLVARHGRDQGFDACWKRAGRRVPAQQTGSPVD